MPTFAFTIHDKDFDFLPKSYFLVYPRDDEDLFGRTVFTAMSKLEKEREVREHRESGSKYPWQGGSVETPAPVTFSRGLAVRDGSFGQETGFDNGLEAWYQTGIKATLYVDVYNDNAEDSASSAPKLRYQLEKAKPQKYTSYEGDAKSSDTCLEELTVVISKWSRVPVSGIVDQVDEATVLASGVT